MTRLASVSSALVFSVALFVACSSDDTSGGSSTSSSGKSGSSSSGTIGGGSSSSSGTASSSSGGVSLTGYATAICEKLQKCQPGTFSKSWAIKAECIADVEASNEAAIGLLPGLSVSQEQASACAAKITASSCAFGVGDLAECVLKGTLPTSTPCYDGRQCQTGRCKRTVLSADCGRCATFEEIDGACIEDGDCDFGLTCSDGHCAKLLAKTEVCTVDGGKRCAAGLVCAKGACAEPAEKDGACTATGNECRRGLVCNGTTCKDATFKVAGLGDKCDGSTTCRKSSCRGTPGSEVCVAWAKAGQSCGTESNGPADCDGDSTCAGGQCAENTYPECK